MSKRRSGLSNHRRAYVYGCNNDTTQPCATTIEGLRWDYFTPTGDYSQYNQGWNLTWDPIPNGTVYLITQPDTVDQIFELLTSTSGNLYLINSNNYNDFIVYAHVTGCSDISGSIAPCFLKGALVSLADG
jgi:hypothetical protein